MQTRLDAIDQYLTGRGQLTGTGAKGLFGGNSAETYYDRQANWLECLTRLSTVTEATKATVLNELTKIKGAGSTRYKILLTSLITDLASENVDGVQFTTLIAARLKAYQAWSEVRANLLDWCYHCIGLSTVGISNDYSRSPVKQSAKNLLASLKSYEGAAAGNAMLPVVDNLIAIEVENLANHSGRSGNKQEIIDAIRAEHRKSAGYQQLA